MRRFALVVLMALSLCACAAIFAIDTIDYGATDAAPTCKLLERPDGQARCNEVPAGLGNVTPTCQPGVRPEPTGGLVVDGHYVLVGDETFETSSCGDATRIGDDLEVCASEWQESSSAANFDARTSGATIVLTVTCGFGTGQYSVWDYTAGVSTLDLYDGPAHVRHYLRI